MSGRPAECRCDGCRLRREAQQRWVAKNRKKKNATNYASQRRTRAARRAALASEMVTDTEMDRRALEMNAQTS